MKMNNLKSSNSMIYLMSKQDKDTAAILSSVAVN